MRVKHQTVGYSGPQKRIKDSEVHRQLACRSARKGRKERMSSGGIDAEREQPLSGFDSHLAHPRARHGHEQSPVSKSGEDSVQRNLAGKSGDIPISYLTGIRQSIP